MPETTFTRWPPVSCPEYSPDSEYSSPAKILDKRGECPTVRVLGPRTDDGVRLAHDEAQSRRRFEEGRVAAFRQ